MDAKSAGLKPTAFADGGRAFASLPFRLRRDEQHTIGKRPAVVLSLFLVLLAAALLTGGHAVIDPLLRAAAAARETHRLGEIVFTKPDGTFCRPLSFDKKTAAIAEGAVEPCAPDWPDAHADGGAMGFTWRAR
ncbi:MAG: hypothetical protein P4L80_07360 [Xanthobacteraceae bacterium]|nr:hypothetical protein [Xanthobacteraceae bacterium]